LHSGGVLQEKANVGVLDACWMGVCRKKSRFFCVSLHLSVLSLSSSSKELGILPLREGGKLGNAAFHVVSPLAGYERRG